MAPVQPSWACLAMAAFEGCLDVRLMGPQAAEMLAAWDLPLRTQSVSGSSVAQVKHCFWLHTSTEVAGHS